MIPSKLSPSIDFSPDFVPQSSSVIRTRATIPGLPHTLDDDPYGGVLFLRAGPDADLPPLPTSHDRALPNLPPERPLPRQPPQTKQPIISMPEAQPDPPPKQTPRKRRFIVDEDERKRKLEEDLKLAAEIRQQKAEAERREEEERRLAIQERQQRAKQKRLEQGRAAQEWRSQHMKELQESARKEEEARQRVLQSRRDRSQTLSSSNSFADSPFSSWVSAQSTGSPVWRRKYCRVQNGLMRLYKDSVVRTHSHNPTSVRRQATVTDCHLVFLFFHWTPRHPLSLHRSISIRL